jgi:hypothetical protein
MKTKYWILGACLLLIASAALVWAFYPRESPYSAQAQQLASKIMDENLTDEQRRAVRDEMRQLRDSVPEEQRGEVFRAMGEQFRQRMESHMREFAQLPEDQRDAFLDRDIDRMESMRKEFEKRRAERASNGGGGGPPFGGGDGRGPGAGGGGPRGDRGPGSGEDRESWRRRRLDNSTPEQRALMTEYFQALAERRKERGLDPMPPFGGPRGGGPRGGGPR